MHETPKQRFRKFQRRGITVVVAGFVALVALCFWQGNILRYRENFSLYFHSGVHGLSVGAPVKMRGQDIGKVVEIKLARNPHASDITNEFFAEVVISVDSKELALHGGIAEGEFFSDHVEAFIERGMRGQLKMPSMLAAGLCVDLAFLPETQAKFVHPTKAHYPEIPTNYTSSSEFVDRANDFIETQNLIDISKKIGALRERIEKFVNFAENFDGAKINERTLAMLDIANTAVDAERANSELSAINREISEIRATILANKEIPRESAEKLVAALQRFSASLKIIREGARAVKTQLEPETFNAHQREINEPINEIVPFVRTIKDFLF